MLSIETHERQVDKMTLSSRVGEADLVTTSWKQRRCATGAELRSTAREV